MTATTLAASADATRAHVGAPPTAERAHLRVAASNPYTRTRKVLGDPTPLACTLAKTAAEVVSGGMGIETLARWVAPQIRDLLAQQYSLARRAGHHGRSIAVQRVRVCRISARAAEVSVVVNDGTHARAIAMRLEDIAGKWMATAMDIG